MEKVKCPICGAKATITDKDGVVEMDCPNCRVKISKTGTLEDARKYLEGGQGNELHLHRV